MLDKKQKTIRGSALIDPKGFLYNKVQLHIRLVLISRWCKNHSQKNDDDQQNDCEAGKKAQSLKAL